MLFYFSQLFVAVVYLFHPVDNFSPASLIDSSGKNVAARIQTPAGFSRIPVEANSFAAYLRNLPVHEHAHVVKYYNGETKRSQVYDAVIKIDVGNSDLQQCADAVMRLRAEYLLQQKRYDEINFNFTNGFNASYAKWRNGFRIITNAKGTHWIKVNEESTSYASFRKYLDEVFMYAGTLSLSKQLKSKNIESLMPGDVFIKGGSPGHAMIVLDAATNKFGRKIFLLAQSYMPAQEIHIVKNYNEVGQSPWYSVNNMKKLETPEWTFNVDQLKTW